MKTKVLILVTLVVTLSTLLFAATKKQIPAYDEMAYWTEGDTPKEEGTYIVLVNGYPPSRTLYYYKGRGWMTEGTMGVEDGLKEWKRDIFAYLKAPEAPTEFYQQYKEPQQENHKHTFVQYSNNIEPEKDNGVMISYEICDRCNLIKRAGFRRSNPTMDKIKWIVGEKEGK